MIKWHFDVRLVFHRPNKCTEWQYVFSSDVQPGPIIDGCLRLDKAQELRSVKACLEISAIRNVWAAAAARLCNEKMALVWSRTAMVPSG